LEDREILELIRQQIADGAVRVTEHAHEEMVEESITLDAVYAALLNGKVIENYAEHRRGPCCLIGGRDRSERPIHIVCTTGQPMLILITVYEPKPPKWPTPETRRTEA
jgi:hypothetical protein